MSTLKDMITNMQLFLLPRRTIGLTNFISPHEYIPTGTPYIMASFEDFIYKISDKANQTFPIGSEIEVAKGVPSFIVPQGLRVKSEKTLSKINNLLEAWRLAPEILKANAIFYVRHNRVAVTSNNYDGMDECQYFVLRILKRQVSMQDFYIRSAQSDVEYMNELFLESLGIKAGLLNYLNRKTFFEKNLKFGLVVIQGEFTRYYAKLMPHHDAVKVYKRQ